MKWCLTLLLIIEMQIKTRVGYNFTPQIDSTKIGNISSLTVWSVGENINSGRSC